MSWIQNINLDLSCICDWFVSVFALFQGKLSDWRKPHLKQKIDLVSFKDNLACDKKWTIKTSQNKTETSQIIYKPDNISK